MFRNVRDCATGELRAARHGERFRIGVDLAKVEDYTVIVVMNRQREVVHVDRFNRIDWNLQIGRIRSVAQAFRHDSVLVDSTGAGEPIYESLLHAGCHAQPYPFTQRSKSALVDALAMMFEQGQIVLPRPELWPEGIDELEAFEYSISDAGNVRSSAPAGMHDDCVMALALAAWYLRPSQPDRSSRIQDF